MKRILGVAAVAMTLISASGALADERIVTLAVDNLFCITCPYIVKQTLARIDGVSAVVERASAATEEMTARAGEVGNAVESVSAIAEENSASSEEMSASSEQMSAQVEEVVASSQTLTQMADELNAAVVTFKLDDSGAGERPASGSAGHAERLPDAA